VKGMELKRVALIWRAPDNPNTTQTLEYTKDKYNAKIRKIKSLS
jgi:hypothetical protein